MSAYLQTQTKAVPQPSFTPVHRLVLQRCTATEECAECRQRRLATMQRASVSAAPVNTVPPIVHEVLNSSGHPLDAGTSAFMEPRFGHDFSQVRVHTDAQAAESARAVNALAYTVGQNVVFGAGQYAPATSAGKKLLAHELTHTIQQQNSRLQGKFQIETERSSAYEQAAERAEQEIDHASPGGDLSTAVAQASSHLIQRKVNPASVSCHDRGLTNPNLTGEVAIAAIQAAEAEAITLARRAELLLDFNLLLVEGGLPVDPEFDTILQEELGLSLTNRAQFPLIRQQISRFRRVRELLESGFLRYLCRGGTVSLVGCAQGTCGDNFAFSCPANRLMVLCQAFWDNPDQRAATILHEPFHILFDMERHAANALRRADASCFESFALRVAGQAAFASCVGHTAG